MPVQKDYNHILMPVVTGFTTLLLGRTILELATHGGVHSPDPMADAYLLVMGAYAGAGEVEKWTHAAPWDPANDPRLERAQRAGAFVILWAIPFFAAYLWRIADPTAPFPGDLKTIWLGLFGIFVGKTTSLSIRHSRKGLFGFAAMGSDSGTANAEADSSLEAQLIEFLASCPDRQATTPVISSQFPDFTARHLRRVLTGMIARKLVIRDLVASTQEAVYRLASPLPKAP
jgi:hypothetical protein